MPQQILPWSRSIIGQCLQTHQDGWSADGPGWSSTGCLADSIAVTSNIIAGCLAVISFKSSFAS
ncbi:hypothetical protein DPMN_186507 [Dreissena polymorpha]|uniref:Uncharacterized protein n=1 Tax=Dreissena polymorpha TaxID=45954 RepID=A0A9D4I882_DREPO|nr:hypothetical protein DPMN_186507 [Dreissena polymorpha]